MPAFISRLFARFTPGHSKSGQQGASTSCNDTDAVNRPIHSTVTEPVNFSLASLEQGFYATIFSAAEKPPPLSTEQMSIVANIKTSLKDEQKRIKSIPRLPSVIPKLLKSLRDPNASAKDYVNIVNKDPTLSTAVLKMANSVYFNPHANSISSIETAVVKLGMIGLRTVLSTAVMQPVMQAKSKHLSQFSHQLWSHSLYCASACELIALQHKLEPFKAYLLGLVHDIGSSTIVNQISLQHTLNNNHDKIDYSAYSPFIQANGKTLSATIAADWQLPEEICAALQQQANVRIGSSLKSYALVLFQANLACEMYAICNRDEEQMDAALKALAELQLPEDLFKRLDQVATEL